MKLAKIAITALAVFGLTAGVAAADNYRSTEVKTGTYKVTVPSPCMSETIVFEPNFNLTTRTSTDGSGQYHVHASFTEDGYGVGQETGQTYKISSKGTFLWNGATPTHELPPHEPVASSFVTNTQVTSPDGAVKHIQSKVKIVVDNTGKLQNFKMEYPCIVAN